MFKLTGTHPIATTPSVTHINISFADKSHELLTETIVLAAERTRGAGVTANANALFSNQPCALENSELRMLE